MRELLPAEFYKLYKSLGFRVCLIVFFVQDIIYLISVGFVGDILGIELTGDFQFQYLLGSFSGSSVSGMLFGFIAASLITSDYKSRDIQCAIAQGHSRVHIMFAKIIVYIVAIWILSLEDILVYTVGGCICGGFGKAFTMDVAGYMLRSVACEGFVLLSSCFLRAAGAQCTCMALRDVSFQCINQYEVQRLIPLHLS